MTKAGGVHPLELDGIEISPAVALEALYTRVAVAVNQHRGTGALALPELDAASRALLGVASLPPLPEPVPDMQVDALYLATEIYPAGGHRILLEQLIRSRPQDRHKVVFTGLLNNTRAFGVARMEDYGVPVFNTDARDILWDKWMALRAHVAACAPERIFLLHHSEDILAALLAQEFAQTYGRRLIFVRHADTVPSLGADILSATHLAIRPAQAQALKAQFPELALHSVPLCFDPQLTPLRLVAEMPVALTRQHLAVPRRTRLRTQTRQALRLAVWKGRRTKFAILNWRAKQCPLPPPDSLPLVTATCGTEHKFQLEGNFALPAVIVAVLKAGARRHVHIGPASVAMRNACLIAMDEAGLPRNRLYFSGEVPSVADVLRVRRVTLFLGSFPVGGALSRAEAAWAGVPIALLRPPTGSHPYLAGMDFAPEAALCWSDLDDLIDQIGHWTPTQHQRLSASALLWYNSKLSPEAFSVAVDALIADLPTLPRSAGRNRCPALEVTKKETLAEVPVRWIEETRPLVCRTPPDQISSIAYPQCQVTVNRPRVVALDHIAPPAQRWDLASVETVCWPQARVVGGADGHITRDGAWYDPGLEDLDPDMIALRDPGPVQQLVNGEVCLRRGEQCGALEAAVLGTGCYSHNYYHFLLEVLPRIRAAARIAPEYTPILTEDDLPTQCYQVLRMVLPYHPVIRLKRGQTVAVDRLYTSGMGTVVNDLKVASTVPPVSALRYHPDLVAELAQLGVIGRGSDGPKRLFLWRFSRTRIMRNAVALRNMMVAQGFTVVDTVGMPFADQIRLMAGAECIVAQSGAHLTNLVFAPNECRVIALFSNAPGINFRLWSALGQLSNLSVINIAGEQADQTENIHADFTIPEALLRPLIAKDQNIPVSVVEVLTELRRTSFDADVLTGAWAVVAGETPAGFALRVAALRRAAVFGIGDVVDARALLGHDFFTDYGRNLRSGFTAFGQLDAAEQAAGAEVLAALTKVAQTGSDAGEITSDGDVAEPDMLRKWLMHGMLLLPNWQVPLPADPQGLPEDVLERWLHWASLPPFLGRAGEDAAWVAHVARLLDWIADGLDATAGGKSASDVALRKRLMRLVTGLDLGQLLLVDVPLNDVQKARNRVLEHVAVRSGTPRMELRNTETNKGQKTRIGVLCRTFEKGPDSEAVVAFFQGFDRDRYEIYAYSVGFRDRVVSRDPDFDLRFDATVMHRRELPGDPSGIRAQILADDLDVFLYANATTYGIQPMDVALYHRVAPVQVVLNSHVPMAMGYPSFDAVITGQSDDPAQEVAQSQHSERLIRVPGPVISYLTSFEPRKNPVLNRASLGLLETDIVMMNAGSSMKLRHESLRAMMRAVVDVPAAKLLLAPYNPGWAARSLAFAFNLQVAEVAAEVGLDPSRIVVLGELSVAEAEAALSCADIYLNPFPHGGATMTHLALIYGVPPVTLRRGSTRSIDQFLISALGFEELLASSVEGYVALAQKLAGDPELRETTAARLRTAARNPVFVDSPAHSKDMQAAVEIIIKHMKR